MRQLVCATAVMLAIGCNIVTGATDFYVDVGPGGQPDGATPPPSSGTENCLNGVDDDNDGLADCADPKCQSVGYACSAVPEGWLGPFATTSGLSTLPSCAAPFDVLEIEGKDGLHADPAACNCSCGAPSGATCSAGVYAGMSDCTVTSTTIRLDCKQITGSNVLRQTGVSGSGGTCKLTPSTQGGVTWDRSTRACRSSVALPVGGCAGVARCAPPVPQGFAPGHCIARDGEGNDCPSEYPTKRVIYRGLEDDRTCDGCACVPPECPDEVRGYSTVNCSGTAYAFDNVCRAGQSTLYSVRIGSGAALQCKLVPGTPKGAATPTNPLTICCAG